jgi:hypothetical protein
MPEKFQMNINRNLLNSEVPQNPKTSDDNMNRVMRLCDDIMGVFEKNNSTMEEAYLTLVSLADSIYMYSMFNDKL